MLAQHEYVKMVLEVSRPLVRLLIPHSRIEKRVSDVNQ